MEPEKTSGQRLKLRMVLGLGGWGWGVCAHHHLSHSSFGGRPEWAFLIDPTQVEGPCASWADAQMGLFMAPTVLS